MAFQWALPISTVVIRGAVLFSEGLAQFGRLEPGAGAVLLQLGRRIQGRGNVRAEGVLHAEPRDDAAPRTQKGLRILRAPDTKGPLDSIAAD